VAPTGVVLLSMGGPDSLDAVRPFLRNLFSDPLIFPVPGGRLLAPLIAWRRAPEARRYYERIGGRSPLIEETAKQAAALAETLGAGYVVTAAHRYWGPDERAAVEICSRAGARTIVALPMYPQYCSATSASSLGALKGAAAERALDVVAIDRFAHDEGYLDALARGVRETLAASPAGARPHVVFSAHGVPLSLVRKGDPYVAEVEATVRAVRRTLPAGVEAHLAYQSRVGPMKWVEPRTEDVLRDLGARGVESVVMVPISFVTEHVETLDEMDVRLAALAREHGVRDVRRVPALGTAPDFIEALAALVSRKATVPA
jgi:protoporphyrin/coproporphyrin ferrochelatase